VICWRSGAVGQVLGQQIAVYRICLAEPESEIHHAAVLAAERVLGRQLPFELDGFLAGRTSIVPHIVSISDNSWVAPPVRPSAGQVDCFVRVGLELIDGVLARLGDQALAATAAKARRA